MFRRLNLLSTAVGCALLFAFSAQAQGPSIARPLPARTGESALDLGPLAGATGNAPLTVTLAMNLRNASDAEALLTAVHTPGNAQFHQFLTASQFNERFGPTPAQVSALVTNLAQFGLSARQDTALTLKVTGSPMAIERAFTTSLHQYSVSPSQGRAGYSFHAPTGSVTLPGAIASSVSGVFGLDTRPAMRPHRRSASATARQVSRPTATGGNPYGYLTVTDLAANYDINPLYAQGITGAGQTIGIATCASFTPSDAFNYWSAVGLTVNPNRICIVNVDGGPGAPSDASGSDETTLDVEQSGGVAPGARVVVYQSPNTNQGQIDMLALIGEDNLVGSASESWGSWEWFNTLAISPVINPLTGQVVSENQAIHAMLVRLGLQGQSFIASSGDSGAYEIVRDLGCVGAYDPTVPGSCSQVLSVNSPATDPAATAAGGTTLAGTQVYCLNASCTQTLPIQIATEQVWGWDYLVPLCTALGYDPVSCGIYSVGTGGGVSVQFRLPDYQQGVSGIQRSAPGQVFQADPALAAADGLPTSVYTMPAHYAGRNLPDVSMNADPETGYAILYTSNVNGYELLTYIGGTSFVAPQLNGVTALLNQDLHHRVGLLNYPLYSIYRSGNGYRGAHAPFRATPAGDNWYYSGSNGYNLGTGVGILDVANFARALKSED